MRDNSLQLVRPLRWTVHAAVLLLWATGLAWSLLEHYGQVPGEFGPQPHPVEPWVHRAHGLLAMGGLVLFGALIPIHVLRGWRARRNRPSGALISLTLVLLCLTGYGLYYVGGEAPRRVINWTHTLVGFVLPAIVAGHVIAGRRSGRGR